MAYRSKSGKACGDVLTRRRFSACLLGLAALPFLGGLSSCGNQEAENDIESQQAQLFVFDTFVTLQAQCSAQTLTKAVERCGYFENTLSRTVEGSDVWRVNHAQGQPVEVSQETADCLGKALEYARITEGAFDPTIGALTELWDFSAQVVPDADALAEACTHVDFRKVVLDGTTVQLLDPAAALDLGGMAKGFIADDLARLLREEGCSSACINLGGNVYVVGAKPDGQPWTVGVQDPNGQSGQIIAKASCEDISVVTSGLYEKHFVVDGVDYHHILDSRTGYPVDTDVITSSFASTCSADADGYATICFLLGSDRGLQLVEGAEGVDGLVQTVDGAVLVTSDSPFLIA